MRISYRQDDDSCSLTWALAIIPVITSEPPSESLTSLRLSFCIRRCVKSQGWRISVKGRLRRRYSTHQTMISEKTHRTRPASPGSGAQNSWLRPQLLHVQIEPSSAEERLEPLPGGAIVDLWSRKSGPPRPNRAHSPKDQHEDQSPSPRTFGAWTRQVVTPNGLQSTPNLASTAQTIGFCGFLILMSIQGFMVRSYKNQVLGIHSCLTRTRKFPGCSPGPKPTS